ncbi:protoporphyrinogen oxidase [Cladophialophora bantiana CBS 173.52]|uniref:Protoporphyrinogen oxidase n=1 Tax=Cladophialophora bantiana (strain ATCC 10958 / CBS 173.52 / CDC B-1940 / NIH 8579) TaxID=1442370 RepID=A0A0D2IDI1_CLAB1|nr:protoporphyrinogen oxidase [Cladophialophora bantiana CBS 173.52]KIW94819.1 protoporphyrinogen oxidase [Cladophialophora bantiana CBS 173.52]
MRVGGCSAPYQNVVKYALQSRATLTLRTFHTTAGHGYIKIRHPGGKDELPPPNPHAREIAILGGGFTGLATAFLLSSQLPTAKITILEKSNRLGGWVDSEVVRVDKGEVLFEWGPRTLRAGLGPAPLAMLELLAQLRIGKDLVAISKSSPAALNRYIYYPDHLVRLPVLNRHTSLLELLRAVNNVLTEPLYDGIWRCLREPWVPPRDENVRDESVGDFVSRRFDKNVADNLLSAVCHGIFAGDIYRLSARTLLPQLWHLETRDREKAPGILLEILSNMANRVTLNPVDGVLHANRQVLALRSLETYYKRIPNLDSFGEMSVFTFRRGLGQITSSLERELRKNENITILQSSPVEDVVFNENKNQVSVRRNPSGITSNYDYVVSTLGPRTLKQFLSRSAQALSSALDPKVTNACDHSDASVNVMVVNLYYSNQNLLPPSVRGFGYLIPRSVPLEQNPERALGVIFSSETSGRSDSIASRSAGPYFISIDSDRGGPLDPDPPEDDSEIVLQDTAPGTKLTVMLGGHWWSEWAPSDLPSEEQAIEMAQTLLRRHLNIQESPEVAKARLNRDCIPQYPVGYAQDMATIHEALTSMYHGRLKLAGPWWRGAPGMSDCVLSARESAWAIRDKADDYTGLQGYTHESWLRTHVPTGTMSTEHVQ